MSKMRPTAPLLWVAVFLLLFDYSNRIAGAEPHRRVSILQAIGVGAYQGGKRDVEAHLCALPRFAFDLQLPA